MSIPGKRLMIYIGESDSWQGHSLYLSLLDTLRKHGIAGATVTRAIAGFGAHSRIRTSTIEVLSIDLPLVVSVIDNPEAIERAVDLVSPMVREGLITVEDIEIVKQTHHALHRLPTERPVTDIMTRDVTTVTPDTPARQVVELLLGKLFKAVPVIDEQKRVVGIISSSDLLRKAGMPVRLAVGERLEADDLRAFITRVSNEKTARQIMTTPVVTARADQALGLVVHQMIERKLKRIPVVDDDGKLIGMLSRLDVLRAVSGSDPGQQEHAPTLRAGRTLGELMSPHVPTVYLNTDLVDVLHEILQTDLRRVIVLDEQDQPVGVITDGDVVARVNDGTRANVLQVLAARVLGSNLPRGSVTAGDLMSQHVLAAPKDMAAAEAISLLMREGRKRLVVVDEQGHPVGLVDRQTLLASSSEL